MNSGENKRIAVISPDFLFTEGAKNFLENLGYLAIPFLVRDGDLLNNLIELVNNVSPDVVLTQATINDLFNGLQLATILISNNIPTIISATEEWADEIARAGAIHILQIRNVDELPGAIEDALKRKSNLN